MVNADSAATVKAGKPLSAREKKPVPHSQPHNLKACTHLAQLSQELRKSKEGINEDLVRELIPKVDNYHTAHSPGDFLPLANAALQGHFFAVKAMIEHGVSADLRCQNLPALFFAIRECEVEMARFLIENGASLEIDTGGYSGKSPLHWLMHSGSEEFALELVDLMIEKGANIHAGLRHTPLYEAAKKGWGDLFQRLLDHGSDINWTNAEGQSLKQLAVSDVARLQKINFPTTHHKNSLRFLRDVFLGESS